MKQDFIIQEIINRTVTYLYENDKGIYTYPYTYTYIAIVKVGQKNKTVKIKSNLSLSKEVKYSADVMKNKSGEVFNNIKCVEAKDIIPQVQKEFFKGFDSIFNNLPFNEDEVLNKNNSSVSFTNELMLKDFKNIFISIPRKDNSGDMFITAGQYYSQMYLKVMSLCYDCYKKNFDQEALYNIVHFFTPCIERRTVKVNGEATDMFIGEVASQNISPATFQKNPYMLAMKSILPYSYLTKVLPKDDKSVELEEISAVHDILLESVGVSRYIIVDGKKSNSVNHITKQSSYLRKNEIMHYASKVIDNLTGPHLDRILSNGIALGEFVKDSNGRYFKTEIYNMEVFVAEKTTSMNKMGLGTKESPVTVEEINESVKKRAKERGHGLFNHDKEQIKAIKNIASSKYGFDLLLGGAGTGKTFTINTVVDICLERGYCDSGELLFLAPTAKAAKVLQDSVNHKARTVASVITPKVKSISAKIIIIDEGSMISLKTMYELLMRIDNDAKIIILGDKNQLPSIEFGKVLHDIEHKSGFEINYLNIIHRQKDGSPIIDFAYKFVPQNGKINPLKEADFATTRCLEFAEMNDLDKFIKLLDEKLEYFGNLDKIQIISPTRNSKFPMKIRREVNDFINNNRSKGNKVSKQQISDFRRSRELYYVGHGLSVNTINRKIQNYYIKNSSPIYTEAMGKRFAVGDKVYHNINKNISPNVTHFKGQKYPDAPGVFNGDFGIVVDVEDSCIYVQMENKKIFKYLSYEGKTPEELDFSMIDLAYAITVHKSQGSGWHTTILLTDDSDSAKFSLNRNLLYTAITRSRTNLVIGTFFANNISRSDYFNEALHKDVYESVNTFMYRKEG